MKHTIWHRFLAAVLAGVLCCSMFPVSAFAAELPDAFGTVALEQTVEEAPGEAEESKLPDTTAPPEETPVQTPEEAPAQDVPSTPENVENAKQTFIAAVNALDREGILAKMNAWGLANRAWQQDPDSEERNAALEQAIAESDQAAAPVYAADDLYNALSEEEKSDSAVSAAYSALAALIVSMQYIMQNPSNPGTEPAAPSEDVMDSVLFADLPDAPTGSYIGSMGLPVATGETKISIGAWNSDLVAADSTGRLDAAQLNQDNITVVAEREAGDGPAIVPLSIQVEYPANGSHTSVLLPEDVSVLSFTSTADALVAASESERDSILRDDYGEVSAAASGFYLQADHDFSAQLQYAAPDGSILSKTVNVHIVAAGSGEATARRLQQAGGAVVYAERPTPTVLTGVITKCVRGSGTWIIWFNGEEAYCCSHGLQGKANGCPPYSYAYTSLLGADQMKATHEETQINIWGALGQLSLGLLSEQHSGLFVDSALYSTMSSTYMLADTSVLEYCYKHYDDTQMHIILNYPDSVAAQLYVQSAKAAMGLADDASTYVEPQGYYTFIYTPSVSGWQTLAVIGPPIPPGGEEEIPDVPQEYYASWSVGPQSASGSFDSDYTVGVDKIQLEALEKVDGATIEIEPIEKSGTIDGGNWAITPAGVQTVTTSGHTQDDSYHSNGGDASAVWSLHYAVSKTTSGGRSGQVGPYSSQSEADAAASSAEDSARSELQAEAQSMVDQAIATAKDQLATLNFRFDEITVPYGFAFYDGEKGSTQTIVVPANQAQDYLMRNDEWSLQINLKKVDSETGNSIAADAQYEIYEWDVVTQKYIPYGGYNRYKVERQPDGTYAVINHSAYADTTAKQHTMYYTQRNEGKFVIAEVQAPSGYFGDWTDINAPGTAGTALGKRGYYIEITKANDGSVLWLDNADYSADIATKYTGGTKLVTGQGVETTVTIYKASEAPAAAVNYKDAARSYDTDNSRTAANEDGYAMMPKDSVFQNDRVLGEISLSKVDLDAVRYVAGRDTAGNALASGQAHADATLDGAVYDLYAAADIHHPDGVTGIVDYSKITDADGNPIWHTTIRDNGGHWITDYLPILAKDHLVASAEIKDGWLTFANLYLGQYYIVERSTGTVIPVSDGAFVISGAYPEINAKTKQPTGSAARLASDNGRYTDWVYKNQFSGIAQSKALDGTKTYDGYYSSYAKGYLCDEHNYYITPAYANEGFYIEKTAFADDRQAAGEALDTTDYSANYHVHKDNALAESDDQIVKGNVELSKVVSSTGSSDGIELEHAGFTFYLISDLSKIGEFTSARTGSYKLNSILAAYLNATYDQDHPKYDFSAETQAIAKTYELSTEEIEAYNLTLTEAGDYKNGVGDGWVATGNPNEYQLAEIFSNDTGNIRVKGLPYGQYLVVETTTPKDVLQAEPFIVTIDATNDTCPQSAMTTPKDAAIPGSDSYQKYTVLDEEMEVYLKIIKRDEETGKSVCRAGTAFQIYWLDEMGNYALDKNGTPRLVTMTATQDGSVAKKIDTFYTNAEGSIALPEKLPLGHYRIVEITGPEGFYNEWVDTTQYDENGVLLNHDDGSWDTGTAYVDFEVTTDRIYQATGDDNEDSQDTLVIEESYSNHETLGRLTIRKMGEVLTGFEYVDDPTAIDPMFSGETMPGHYTYEERPIAGAEYTITAAEDIYTQDNQMDASGNRTLWYAEGDVVAVVTTGDGTSDVAAFAPARTDATYAFLSVIHDGTVGEVSVTLPLGSYHIEETKPPYGFVGTAQSYDVTFVWDNQSNDFVLAKSIVNHAEDGSENTVAFDIVNYDAAPAEQLEQQVLIYHNEREKARVGVYKIDSNTGEFAAGAVFELYTDDDIYNADGELVFAAGERIVTSPATAADGYTYFDADVPVRGAYYGQENVYIPTESGFSNATNSGNYTIVELRAPEGFFLNDTPMQVSFTYDGEVLQVLDSTCPDDATEVLISKRELTGDAELPGATLTIKDHKGNVVREWVSTDKPTEIRALHLGEIYTLTETRPADGYALASDITFRLVQKENADGKLLHANEVYILTGKDWLVFDHWTLLEDGMVVMRDDITRVSISKKDITTKQELPGAHLTITDANGKVIEDWVSTDEPHYVEKMPAGTYTLTEVTAPAGYDVAEVITFVVQPTGEIQHVVMYDWPTPDTPLVPDIPKPFPQTGDTENQ